MAKFRSELRVPVELDRRSFADRYRDRLESDCWEPFSRSRGLFPKSLFHKSTVETSSASNTTSTANPNTTSSSATASSPFIPWHRHFSNGSISPTDFPDGNDWFQEMRRRMDERRRRWDEDVRRMRREFFTLDPRQSLAQSPSPPRMLLPHSRTLSSGQPFSTSYETSPDGTMRFVANFDVFGFDPEQMKVTVRDNELFVTARIEERLGTGATSREYTRSVKLPYGTDEQHVAATLTSDNVLTISCPMRRHTRSRSSGRLDSDVHSTETHDSFSPPSDSHGSGENAPAQNIDHTQTREHEVTSPMTTTYRSATSTGNRATPYHRSVTTSLSARPKFRLELPIDSEYSPAEIQIRTLNRRIYVNARHEERGANRTAVREFSKEYDIPDNVDPESLEAKFENGMLYIEASTN